MAIKMREVDPKEADKLANELADKPYGSKPRDVEQDVEKLTRTSISIPVTLQEQVEDLALRNKRAGAELRTVSAIVKVALEQFISNK